MAAMPAPSADSDIELDVDTEATVVDDVDVTAPSQRTFAHQPLDSPLRQPSVAHPSASPTIRATTTPPLSPAQGPMASPIQQPSPSIAPPVRLQPQSPTQSSNTLIVETSSHQINSGQMLDRQNFVNKQAIWESAKLAAQNEKNLYDSTSTALPSMQNNLENLKKHEADLIALLAKVREDIQEAEQNIADHPAAVAACKEKVRAAIVHVQELKKNLKPVTESDAADAAVIDEADQIRRRAIKAINNFLIQ
uniref:Uncharacterized protein n=1 Tax=Leersia perrieri TaxID=77586 RepID=A0A0D9XZB0_9ORYZ